MKNLKLLAVALCAAPSFLGAQSSYPLTFGGFAVATTDTKDIRMLMVDILRHLKEGGL